MKKNIYMIDLNENAISGFTTYKREFFFCLSKYSCVHLNHIILGDTSEDFFIETCDFITTFHVPFIRDKVNSNCIISTLLKLHITNSPNTIFIQNFSPSYGIVKMLKHAFPLCKVIDVIHDFMWAAFLMGDVDKFKRIVAYKEEDKKDTFIRQLYDDNLKTFQSVDKIICLSDDSYFLLNNFYQLDKEKLSVISNGLRDEYVSDISSANVREEFGIDTDCKIILYAGRICKQKGIVDVIKCFTSVVSIYPKCMLVLAGEIDSNIISCINNDVRTRILFLGMLTKVQLYKWYKIADVGILPSYYEQCSYTGIEMKMFGLPIVASDGFGVNNMFTNNNAFIASIGDRNDDKDYQNNLFCSLVRILNAEKIEENYYREKSREHYLAFYQSDIMAEKYIKMIEKL